MENKILVIGASGHAKVIIDIIEREGKYTVFGLIDSHKRLGGKLFGYKIIGRPTQISEIIKENDIHGGIIAIGDNNTRRNIRDKIIDNYKDFNFVSAVHPKAIIGSRVKIGKGTVIMPGVIVNTQAIIKDFCILNTKSTLDHECLMKSFSSLGPGTNVGGNVEIGEFTAISLGAKVIENIIIGDHTVVGAGALVVKNIQDNKVAYGVPAKVIRTREVGEGYLSRGRINRKTFEVITDKEIWDEIVEEIENYDYSHTYDAHILEKKNGETPVLLKYVEGNIIIALPLLIRNIKDTIYKDATSIYGYGGPISKGVDSNFDNNFFLKTINEFFEANNIITVFSRLNPYIPFQKEILNEYGDITLKGKVVYIDLTEEPDIQRQKYQRRLKTYINKSRRFCTIKEVSDKESIQTFIKLYYKSMDRVNANERYYFDDEYFDTIFKSEDFEMLLLLANENETGEDIGGALFIKTGQIVQYHLSGVKEQYSSITPTKLLIDEMRLRANEDGNYKFFNLGGGLGGSNNDSLFNFKATFSKTTKDFELWKLIVNHEVYLELMKTYNVDTTSNYFPLYRYSENNDN